MFSEEGLAIMVARGISAYRADRDGNVVTIEYHNGQKFTITVNEVT